MNLEIIEDNCIGCGICQSINSDIFEVEDVAKVIKTPNEEQLESINDAIENCPTNAIIKK